MGPSTLQGQRTHSVRSLHGTSTNKEKTAKEDQIHRKVENMLILNSVVEYYTECEFKNNFNITLKEFYC